jgi:uracil-DNA glycosylase
LHALELTPLSQVRVVIIGQDPYHGPGQAEGLAFSVAPGQRIPPSLRNIFKELQRDLGLPAPLDGSLIRWASQGVLLLNTSLTVEDASPGSHAGRGWEALTDAIVRKVEDAHRKVVYLLWGAHAQKKQALLERSLQAGHVLCANHPSPLSATRGPVPFIGCGHFSAANRLLQAGDRGAVAW